MRIIIRSNKRIFFAYLLINAAGYNVENNPEGMHPVRIKFREASKKFEGLGFKKIVKDITELNEQIQSYARIATALIIGDTSIINTNILVSFNKFLEENQITELFDDYSKECGSLISITSAGAEIDRVLNLFGRPTLNFDELFIHPNLLESYSRGTNYFKDKIISASLDFSDKLSSRTLRHEFIHLVLKDLLGEEKFEDLEIPVSEDYHADPPRVRFDENFVLAANLFLEDEKLSQGTLKYLVDTGFVKLPQFYEFIQVNFISQHKTLNTDILKKLAVNIHKVADNK